MVGVEGGALAMVSVVGGNFVFLLLGIRGIRIRGGGFVNDISKVAEYVGAVWQFCNVMTFNVIDPAVQLTILEKILVTVVQLKLLANHAHILLLIANYLGV